MSSSPPPAKKSMCTHERIVDAVIDDWELALPLLEAGPITVDLLRDVITSCQRVDWPKMVQWMMDYSEWPEELDDILMWSTILSRRAITNLPTVDLILSRRAVKTSRGISTRKFDHADVTFRDYLIKILQHESEVRFNYTQTTFDLDLPYVMMVVGDVFISAGATARAHETKDAHALKWLMDNRKATMPSWYIRDDLIDDVRALLEAGVPVTSIEITKAATGRQFEVLKLIIPDEVYPMSFGEMLSDESLQCNAVAIGIIAPRITPSIHAMKWLLHSDDYTLADKFIAYCKEHPEERDEIVSSFLALSSKPEFYGEMIKRLYS